MTVCLPARQAAEGPARHGSLYNAACSERYICIVTQSGALCKQKTQEHDRRRKFLPSTGHTSCRIKSAVGSAMAEPTAQNGRKPGSGGRSRSKPGKDGWGHRATYAQARPAEQTGKYGSQSGGRSQVAGGRSKGVVHTSARGGTCSGMCAWMRKSSRRSKPGNTARSPEGVHRSPGAIKGRGTHIGARGDMLRHVRMDAPIRSPKQTGKYDAQSGGRSQGAGGRSKGVVHTSARGGGHAPTCAHGCANPIGQANQEIRRTVRRAFTGRRGGDQRAWCMLRPWGTDA